MGLRRYSHFVCFLLVLGLSGCVSDNLDERFDRIVNVYCASMIYYTQNDRWPNSINELKLFCSENKELCPPLDWDKCATTSFKAEQDGSLKIEFYFFDDPNQVRGGQKPNATITIEKPNIQENSQIEK